jgi:uncharacterized protein (DUF1330 family)
MPAYVIANIEVTDAAAIGEYFQGAPATVAAYGGAYLARGGAIDVAEGDWTPTRLSIIRFDSMAAAKAWIDSPEYAPLRAIRQTAARSRFVVVEGL